jgi:hypothetical protein
MDVIARLLVLLAVLIMPLGMAPAAASASPVGHRAMMAGMARGHCSDQSNKDEHNDGLAMCSMACASALPAQDVAHDGPPLRHHQLGIPIITQTLHGVLLEIATPPPKFA